MSFFVSFEGGEGSGKTTQAKRLAERLTEAGLSAMLVHEPGTTPLGTYLRRWLKNEYGKEQTVSELFLFAAARAELVASVIKPALQRAGAILIADRYADSTKAYQGYGRRLPLDEVEAVNRLATDGVMPDLTFLLDCAPEQGLERLGSAQLGLREEPGDAARPQRIDQTGTLRFEKESPGFHRRVRRGYLELANQEPNRWHVIDATLPVDEISRAVWQKVEKALERRAPATGGEPDLRSRGSQSSS